MGIFKDFKEFAVQGNLVDTAAGIIIGGAFGKIITSLVNDIIMPPIGQVMGGVNFTDLKYLLQSGVAEVKDAAGAVITVAIPEVAIRYGAFTQTILDFIIIAFCIFMVIRMIQKAKKSTLPAPAGPTNEEVLLSEIRDLLKK